MAIFFFLLLFGLSSASYLPNGCPEDPHIHLLLPHETDCTKFYYCVHGEKHLRQCSGGLYFDPVYQVCNWPQNVDCQPTHVTTESVTTTENEVATTEKTTDTTTNYLTTTESSVTTDRNEESTEIITPEQPTAEPTTKESTTVEPTTEESTTVEPTTKESTTVEPTTENPTTVEPTTEESTTEQSTTVEPTTEESTTVEPTTAEPSTEESTTVEPTTEESTTVEPTTENPTTVEPTTEESTTEQSTTVEPTTEESPTEEPTTVEPTTATTEMTIDSEGTTIEVSTVTEPTTNESESSNESRDVESSREPALTTERTVPTTEQQPETPAICPPGFIGNVPHPERCDSYFLCSGWEPIQLFCAPGLEFDAALQICVAIAEGGCNWQNGQLTSTTTHPSTDEESTTTITEEETTTEPATELTTETTVPTTEQQPETPTICPPGFVGNVPHPERCDSYFLCSGWESIQLFCAPGLEFDATLQICVAIAEGGCNWQNGQLTSTSTHPSTDEESTTTTTDEQTVLTTETPTTSEAPMTELTTETTPLTTEQQPETPAICPPGFIGNVPHPERCDSYFLCSGWEPIQLFCAPGLEFDAALQICVAIAEGGCNWQNGQLTSTTTHTTTEQESTTTTTEDQTVPTTETTTASEAPVTGLTTETTLSTTEQQPETPAICPPGFIGNVPHPERCDSYFLCSGWEPIQLFCAPGLEFDADLQICVAIAEGGCNWQNGQLTSTTIHPSTDEESTTRTTEEQTVSTTESQTTSEAPVTDLTTETTLSTTEGPITITTDVPTTVTIEEQTLSTTESQATTDEPATELTTEDKESTTEKQPETSAICPPGFIGNVPHPERCDSYFLCSGWEPIQLFCAPGLEFDAALQTCVAIAEGGCNWQNGQLTSTTAEPSTDGDLTTTEFTSEVFTITTDEQTVATTESQPATEESVTETTDDITTVTEDLTTTTEEPGTITTTTKDTTITTEESTTTITDKQTESTTESVEISTTLSTETTEQQPETPAVCPPGFIGNVPHPERCDSYFLCSGWEPIQLFCAPGLEFDAALQTCVAIAEGGCNWQNGQLTSTTAEPSTDGDLTTTEFTSEVSTITDEQTVSTTESQTATEVTVTETTEETTDDLTTITKDLTTTEEPGTITTTTKDTTITTEESTTTITDKQTESTTESVDISTELSTETTVTTTEQQPETPAICPPGFVGNVPHPERCDSYFLCSGWEPIQLFCAPGLEFDAALQTCVAIAEGGCNWQNGQLTSTTAEPSTDGDLTTTEFTSEVSTITTDEQTVATTEFEITMDPTEQTIEDSTATAEGGITTSNSPTTVELTTVTEELEAEPLCPEGFIGSVPHPDRCDSYYMCTGWTPIQLFCLPGQEFDPVLSQCVVIAEDGCTSRLTNEVVNKQETRSQIHKGDVDRNDLNRKADGSRATAEFANRIARTELCPLGFEGRIATPEGKSFYLCSGGNAIELLCPVESKFDPVTGKCIYKNYEKRMRS
ncbi:mucin-2-like isoform X17 [Pectinophora gossypiella]|uniref:mucin-2-like isoform X16 n=1 Tax=Pectinophora gossypiella TaxID=13191 RepID=UPI00214F315B|nr:mucin-2-like isoform X16 [Pectinophora gossypiella]XP_049882515.1 mucin-2-like isoform X17 [Pectinophora gossypiella]